MVCIPKAMPLGYICYALQGVTPAFRCHGTAKTVPPISSSLFNTRPFQRISPNLCPSPFRTALGSFFPPPCGLCSTSVLLLKWENDGRTIGELRNKGRRKNDRIYIGHRAGKQNKTVIIKLSISHVSALLLNGLRRRSADIMTHLGLIP